MEKKDLINLNKNISIQIGKVSLQTFGLGTSKFTSVSLINKKSNRKTTLEVLGSNITKAGFNYNSTKLYLLSNKTILTTIALDDQGNYQDHEFIVSLHGDYQGKEIYLLTDIL